jgi:archaellum component FlaC
MLSECVVRSQQQIVGHRLIGDSYEMIINTRNSLDRRLQECEAEIALLRDSKGEDTSAKLQQLRDTIRGTHHEYHKQALSLRTSQRMLENQRSALLAPVAAALLEKQIQNAHENLAQSWTTVGLARAIGGFFDEVDSNVRHLEREIERANRVLTSIYERPENNRAEGDQLTRHLLRINKQQRHLRQLHARADDFRMSINSVLASKSIFISRFINTLVQEVRTTYQDLNRVVEHWLQEALTPLFHHNQYQKQLLEHHMLRLTQLQNQRNSYAEQLEGLQTNIYQLQSALSQLEPLYQDIISTPLHTPTAAETQGATVVSLSQVRQAHSGL